MSDVRYFSYIIIIVSEVNAHDEMDINHAFILKRNKQC